MLFGLPTIRQLGKRADAVLMPMRLRLP